MIPFFEYMVDQIRRLLSLWSDDRLTEAIGANFLYIVLSIWLFWMMVNFFLIRPMPGGGLYADAVHMNQEIRARRKPEEAPRIEPPDVVIRPRMSDLELKEAGTDHLLGQGSRGFTMSDE